MSSSQYQSRSILDFATGALVVALAVGLIGLFPGAASAESAGDFADWISVSGSPAVASGTLHGNAVSLSGTGVLAGTSATDGSSTVFNRADFTPPLSSSDAVNFNAASGNSYTLSFGSPVTDPVLHLASLGSTLHFPVGTQIARVSGDAQFAVSGSDVVGQIEAPTDDGNGTVRVSGTFTSLAFTTTSSASTDGVYLQVGAAPPAPPPPPPPPPSGGGGGSAPPPPEVRVATGGNKVEGQYVTLYTNVGGPLKDRPNIQVLYDFGGDGKPDATCNGTQSRLVARLTRKGPMSVAVWTAGVGTSSTRTRDVNQISAITRASFVSPGTPTVRYVPKMPRASLVTGDMFRCERQPADPVADLTDGGGPPPRCATTITFGLVEAIGCLEVEPVLPRFPSPRVAPLVLEAALGSAIGRYREPIKPLHRVRASAAGGGGAQGFLNDVFSSYQDLLNRANEQLRGSQDAYWPHSTRETVRINGLDFIPRNGSKISLIPARGLVYSDDAEVKLGGISIMSGAISLDVSRARGRVSLGSFDPGSLPLLGGFKGIGQVGVELVDRASRVDFRVKLPEPLSLPGEPVTGNLSAVINNAVSLRLDDSQLSVPHAFIGPLEIKDLSVRYVRLARAGCEKGDCWIGGFRMAFYPGGPTVIAQPPPREYGIRFEQGKFKSAGASLELGSARVPLFPEVYLEALGAGLGVHPTVLRGTAQISALEIVRVSGDVALILATDREPYTLRDGGGSGGLDPLIGTTFRSTAIALGGGVDLKPVPGFGSIHLGGGFAVYQQDPTYVRAEGGVDVRFLDLAEISGRIGGDVGPGGFNYGGKVRAAIIVPTWARPLLGSRLTLFSASAIISSSGAAACAVIPHVAVDTFIFGELEAGGRVGVGWRYGESPDLYFADNCDVERYRANAKGAQVRAGRRQTFHIAPGTPAFNVRLNGRGGEPRIVLAGPRGERFSSSEHKLSKDNMMIWEVGDGGRTYVGIRHPSPGDWTITQEPDSPPVTAVATAVGHRPASIRARVTGRSAERLLSYRVSSRPGQKVTFVEQGPETLRVLGTVRGGSGAIRFAPGDGPAGTRNIVARITLDGLPTENLTVTRYRAGRPVTPGAPRVRASHLGGRLAVSWTGVSAARRWVVVVTGKDGSKRTFSVPVRRRSLGARVPATQSGVVTVRGLGQRNLVGRLGRARFRATRRTTTRFAGPINLAALRRAIQRR